MIVGGATYRSENLEGKCTAKRLPTNYEISRQNEIFTQYYYFFPV